MEIFSNGCRPEGYIPRTPACNTHQLAMVLLLQQYNYPIVKMLQLFHAYRRVCVLNFKTHATYSLHPGDKSR